MAQQNINNDVQYVQEKIDEATDWSVIKQIQVNRSYYAGNQWISWDKNNRQVYTPPLKPGEKRYTYNKIKPAVMTLLAKLCKNRVQLEVHPDTNDDERIEVAKAGWKYLKYQWDEDNMDHKTRRLKLHMIVDGFPALKVYADKTKGEDIPVQEELFQELGLDVKQAPTKTGKICTVVVDQMRLKVDPTAEDPEEIKWCVESTPIDVDEIKERYGKTVQKEDIKANTQSIDITNNGDQRRTYSNHAMVHEYWEWPSSKYTKGRKITICGLQKLDYNEEPGENPYIFFPMIPVLGRAVSDGVVKDLTTPQMSYNVKRTAEARILEEMGNPIWLNPLNAADDEDLVNEIGAIVNFTPMNGSAPQRVPGVEPGAGWQNAMERDESDMEDISGAHEISQGATPRGNNTLGGLQLQVEQDETKLAIAVQSYETGIKKWGEKVLRLVNLHFPEEQQLAIVGENGEAEAFAFSGADLSGSEVVDVVPGSSMPTLKAVKDQKIMEMWGQGMFNDPKTGQPDTRKVVRMLGESIESDYFNDTELDENKAKMEQRHWEQYFEDPQSSQALMQWQSQCQMIEQQAMMQQQSMMQGMNGGLNAPIASIGLPQKPPPPVQLPIVRDFYDHQTHIDAHNRFRKGDLYDNLPPELQKIIDDHVQEHINFLTGPAMQQQQQQMMMQQQQAQDQANAQAQAQDQQMQMEQQRMAMEHERTMAMKNLDHQHKMEQTLVQSHINAGKR